MTDSFSFPAETEIDCILAVCKHLKTPLSGVQTHKNTETGCSSDTCVHRVTGNAGCRTAAQDIHALVQFKVLSQTAALVKRKLRNLWLIFGNDQRHF